MLISLVVVVVSLGILWAGFIFLRDFNDDYPKWLITATFAIVWGVGGVALLYWSFNNLAESLTQAWTQRLQPIVFVGPALILLFFYLLYPAFESFRLSLYNRDGTEFVGMANYVEVFTGRILQEAIRNNIMWIVFGSTTFGGDGPADRGAG